MDRPDVGRIVEAGFQDSFHRHGESSVPSRVVRGSVMKWLNRFDSVWSLDFEFSQPPGERPNVVCLVAREYHTGRLIRVDMETLATMRRPPFDVGATALCVAYFSSAEWNCFLSLGWPLPACVLDLWAEFRCVHNGSRPAGGWGLLSCLTHHGFDSMLASEKQELRELAIRGGPYTDA